MPLFSARSNCHGSPSRGRSQHPRPNPQSPILLALLLAASGAQAKPGWAEQDDKKSDAGHTFLCEGEGKTEEDALAAAQGICNDKICKVCGVEVESVTTTNETLKGIDLQRKVIERCRRVRKSETQVKRKSTDCDQNCSAWIEVFYSAEDEKAECPGYTKDDFADPAACEMDVEAFRNVKDRTAESFRERTRDLDQALIHCAKIDVRPTPALMALDYKLHEGMDAFEFTTAMQNQRLSEGGDNDSFSSGYMSKREAMLENRPFWAFYLTTDPELRRQIDESKLLTQRLQLIRDYVANRALVFDVVEAAQAKDLDSPAGVERLRAMLERAPVGGQYGSHDIHFAVLSAFYHPKTDVTPVADEMRKLYAPKDLPAGALWTLALLFAGDGKTTEDEWSYVSQAEATLPYPCVECFRVLLEANDHGAAATRLARFDQAFAFVVPKMKMKNPEVQALKNLVGHNTPGLLAAAMDRVPKTVPPLLSWDFLKDAVFALEPKRGTAEERAALLARVVVWLQASLDKASADAKAYKSECTFLGDKLKLLDDKGAGTKPLEQPACSCLQGPLHDEWSLANRDDLVRWAERHKLSCTKGLLQQPR